MAIQHDAKCHALFIGYLGRPPSATELSYWSGQLAANSNGPFASGLVAHLQTQATFVADMARGTEQLVLDLFTRLTGSAPSMALYSHFVNGVTSGLYDVESLPVAILRDCGIMPKSDGAGGLTYGAPDNAPAAKSAVDLVTASGTDYVGGIENKVSYSTTFTDALDTATENAAYAGDSTAAKEALDSVTNNDATLTSAAASVDTVIAGITSGSADTVTLTLSFTTNAADVLSGSTGNDTIGASIGTYQGGEAVDGKEGVDTLTIRDNANANALGLIRNVEQINFIALGSGGSMDFTDVIGFSSLNVWGNAASASLNNLGTSQLDSALIIGVQSGFGGDLTVGFQDLSNTNDTLRLNIGNASSFGLVESAQAFENVNINVLAQTGANIGMGMNSGVFHGALSAVNLTTGSALTAATTVVLKVDRNATATAGLNINASAVAGNVTLTLGTNLGTALDANLYSAGELIINMGTGNDVVILGGESGGASGYASNNSAFSINMGEGTDTLRVVAFQSGQLLPSAVGVENLDIIALNNGVAGSTAGINFSSITASLANINVWGEASALALVNMTAGATVNFVSGFTGNVIIGLASSVGTADSINIVANNASGFQFHESAQAIETINFKVNGTAYAGSASEIGTATTTFNVQGDQNVTMILAANSANTALTISSTALTAGNLNLTLNASGVQQLNVNLGTGGDTLALASGSYHNNMTASFVGGEGADSLSLVLETSGFMAPQIGGFETLTLFGDNSAVNFLGSSLTGTTTINVGLGSNAASAFTMSKLGSEVSTINVGFWTSSTTGVASAIMNFSFAAAPSTLTVNLNANNATAVGMTTAVMHSLDINSATVLSLNVNGTNNLLIGDIYADEATALTITMASGGVDFIMSALSAANAGSVTINAQGGDINIGSAGFATAASVTINQAGGTGFYSGSYIGNLSAVRGDLTINTVSAGNSAVTAGVLISTATVRDDVTITTNGGDVLIGELQMGLSAVQSSLSGLRLTIHANHSADSVIINTLNVASAMATNATSNSLAMTMTIDGSGDVTIGVLAMTSLGAGGGAAGSAATANTINATALMGTLILGASATLGTGNVNFTVNLGADQASANAVALSNGNDTIRGGGSKDVIEAGGGRDVMYGGAGGDVFVFLSSAGNMTADQLESGQSDFIMDFGSGDTILFSGITTLTSVAGFTQVTGMGTVSALSTATLVGVALLTANNLAIYQASGNTYIEVNLVSAGAAFDSGIVTIVLDGFAGWTSLSSVFNITVGGSGLYITHV